MIDEKFPLKLHLSELRSRLLICTFAVIIFTVVSFIFWPGILDFIAIDNMSFVYLSPQEAFLTRIKLSLALGVLCSMPTLLYQSWKFIKPALSARERKICVLMGLASFLFFLSGIVFNVLFLTPMMLKFFLNYSKPALTPLISISNYTNFLLNMSFAFALVSQIPMIMGIAAMINIVEYETLVHFRGPAVLIIFILSAILTPPDALSQIGLALPMWVLYEIGLLLIRVIKKGTFVERYNDLP